MAENGCSLEDCHTNLFALADLAGIKWRRLGTQSEATFSVDPLEDPVLSSYSKCVQADLLCVWRRQPKIAGSGVGSGNKSMADHGPSSPKELWLFWYGEEPSSLQSFISHDLYEVESGSWESGPLSYECRTLLFKALHNLIERSLLSQNFVRVGKWFVQPYSNMEQLQKDSFHLSMSFNFFLHGDSTVCASVDVRQHPPLFGLSNHHITMASHFQQGTPVLLAPYGLSGQLTGRSSGDSDPKAQQLLEEWKKFYYINKTEESSESSGSLPTVVEVVVAGVRLRYPSSYVLIAMEVEMEVFKMKQTSSPSAIPQNSNNNTRSPFSRFCRRIRPVDARQNSLIKLSTSRRVVEKSWQDWIVASGLNSHSQTESIEARTDLDNSAVQDRVTWNFGDPIQKGNCSCLRRSSKHLRNMTSSSTSSSSANKTVQSLSGFGSSSLTSWKQHQQQIGFKGEKGLMEHRPRHHRVYAPYHRRNKNVPFASSAQDNKYVNANYSIPNNFGFVNNKPLMPATSAFMSSLSSSSFPHNDQHPQGIHTNSKSFLQQMTGGLDSSPNSAAPSPLMATTQGQLSSISHNGGDPTMPTLSPQPPTKSGGGDGRPSSKETGSSESSFKLSNVQAADASSNNGSSAFVPSNSRSGCNQDIKSESEATRTFQSDSCLSVPRIKPADIGKTWLEKQINKRSRILSSSSIKRPTLAPLFEENCEDENWKSLYEYRSDSFFNCLTNQRPNLKSECSLLSKNNLLNDHSGETGFVGSRLKDARMALNVKEEYSSLLPQIKLEDVHQGVLSMESHSNGYNETRNALDLPPSPTGRLAPMTTTTLMRENDLIPNIQDLEKMFDTDEECDPDSPSAMPRPEKSSREDIYGPFRSTSTSTNHGSIVHNQGVLTTKELSRMYPTPPSADNPCSEPSPMMQGTVESDVHHDNHHFSQQPPQQLQHQYSSVQFPFIKEELGSISAALASLKKEYANLYKMPLKCKMPASTDYDPIELPQDNRPALQSNLVYKPQISPSVSLQQHQQPERHTSASKFISSSSADATHSINASIGRRADFVAPFYASQQSNSNNMNPLIVQQQQHLLQQQRTPLSYELMSPASNASSLSRPINSIDNSHPGSTGEVSSLVVNIVLSDSMLNIFKDHNFDSCTLCACNRNIDGSDINTYLVPHNRPSTTTEDQFRCTCAFSAIINRRYGLKSGLFYEDEVEITGIYHNHFDNVYKPGLLVNKNQDKQIQSGNNNPINSQGSNMGSIEEEISQDVFVLLREQFSTQFPSMAILANFKAQNNRAPGPEYARNLEMKDCSEACYAALEFSRQMVVDNCTSQSFVDRNKICLHSWPFHQASAPVASNSQDVVRLLKQLQPLLQDAIQKKRTTRLWESVYTISGPLTWKDFHLLAGRGSKETSEPKSIPYLLVGYDKEWLALSPHAIKHWDKLTLEPLSEPRDVLYLVIAPDNEVILNHATTFFNELGVLYEQCKLGRHRVLHDKLRGGVMRIGKRSESMVEKEQDDEWFKDIGNSPVAAKLRLYAKICCNLLVNLLVKSLTEKRTLYEEAAKSHSAAGGSRFSISNPDQPPSSLYSTSSSSVSSVLHPLQSLHGHNTGLPQTMMQSLPFGHADSVHSSVFSLDRDHSEQLQRDQHSMDPESHEFSDLHNSSFSLDVVAAGQMPYVVIYVIDPFTSGSPGEENRLAFLGILRMFHNMVKLMPEHFRSSIQLQIIPQQTLLSVSQPATTQAMKSLCFSVYSACRRTLKHSTLGRTLTGFGPAASANKLIKKLYPSLKLDSSGTGVVTFNMCLPTNTPVATITTTTLYCPPYILAPPSIQSAASNSILPETWKEPTEKSGILLCAYCLSEDQRFLLATLVDATGELLETSCINIDVPNRSSRRRAAVRRFALQKLWDFILGVIACTTRAWRLVVGRFGRLGHGELKGWSTILSKRNLLASSHHLRRICQMCSLLAAGQCPAILSACLVSTELHPSIHIMIDSVKREENQSSKRQLSTPRDASCTHILVYPTSATAQATDSSAADTHMDFTANELLNEEELLNDFGTEDQEMISDFWGNLDDSPNRMMEDDISPHDDPNSIFGGPDITGGSNHSRGMNSQAAIEQEESNNLNLLQQPQAMGFYVSTAQPGPLPQWFWSSCPQREGHCPVCFKASLHLHCPMVQQNQDDLIHQSSAHKKPTHPLDSYLTCDVLRHVLETYNTLSWLTIDPATNDRRSCLPIHMLILMQLYHGIKTFV